MKVSVCGFPKYNITPKCGQAASSFLIFTEMYAYKNLNFKFSSIRIRLMWLYQMIVESLYSMVTSPSVFFFFENDYQFFY